MDRAHDCPQNSRKRESIRLIISRLESGVGIEERFKLGKMFYSEIVCGIGTQRRPTEVLEFFAPLFFDVPFKGKTVNLITCDMASRVENRRSGISLPVAVGGAFA